MLRNGICNVSGVRYQTFFKALYPIETGTRAKNDFQVKHALLFLQFSNYGTATTVAKVSLYSN